MDLFLKKHLLLSNKNNILELKLGKKKTDNIFDANTSQSTIKNIIKQLKAHSEFKIKTYSYTQEVFIKSNEYFILNKNELIYEIYNIKDYYLDNKFLIKNIEITKDEFIIPTYNIYDNIENIQILDLTINNQLIVRMEEANDKHSIKIVINKPIKIEILEKVLDIFNN
jgi:hypothetical protein